MDEDRDNICTVVFLSFSTSFSFVENICSRVDHAGLIILSRFISYDPFFRVYFLVYHQLDFWVCRSVCWGGGGFFIYSLNIDSN